LGQGFFTDFPEIVIKPDMLSILLRIITFVESVGVLFVGANSAKAGSV